MNLQRLPDGSVRISSINDWHLAMLRRIPQRALPSGEKARRRVFPAPFVPGEATREQQDDWNEFVRPDLEALFAGSLDKVTGDLKTAQRAHAPPPPPDKQDRPVPRIIRKSRIRPPAAPPRRTPRPPVRAVIQPPPAPQAPPPDWAVTIPADHTLDWFRAMNQARLVLSATEEAHRTDNDHIARMFVTGKMDALVDYELLTALCGWWVEAVLQRR